MAIKFTLSVCFRYFICLLFSFFIKNAQAQYETANWIFTDYTLNFVGENPTPINRSIANDPAVYASYSTDDGDLLIYTDGSTVWNGDGTIMKNGEDITPYRTNSIIIPKPGSNRQFYIFSYNAFNVPGNNNHLLSVIVYATIDLEANDRKGEVIEKNKVLYNNMHGTFTISGKCDRSVFWLIGDVDTNLTEGSDKIFIFQIDKNGIKGPFTSKPLKIIRGSDFKLSPDASKLLLTVSDDSGSGTILTDFNPETLPENPITNIRWLQATGGGEFSSNGRFVYLSAGNDVIQYDIQSGNIFVIYSGSDFLGLPQMAANGKIYIPVDGKKKLMVINKPNLSGFSCDFSSSGISIPAETFVLPIFASNLFYSGPFPANAGSDKSICADASVVIGSTENRAVNFSWEPTLYLDDPQKIQPTFQYTLPDIKTDSFTYKLTTYFEGCSNTDFVTIKLNPQPISPVIIGSQSICPGVNGVTYRTQSNANLGYLWNVSGGTIDGNATLDSLRVNWGTLNSDAQVGLQVFDQWGCASDVTHLNVVISAQLQTETPQGLDSVCVNLTGKNTYQITKTSGSTYSWGILGGEIIRGQGTNTALVNWQSIAVGKIWVNEKSMTSDAVCSGESDTLKIILFKDPASINLDYISVDEIDEKRIHLKASTSYANRIKQINIISRRLGSGIWEEIDNIPVSPNVQVSLDNFLTDDYVYQFQLNILNGCEEWSSSKIHNSILLKADGKEEQNEIDLFWNSYQFWTMGEVGYEILVANKEPKEFQKLITIQGDTSTVISGDENFQYFLRVKALASDGAYASLSNEVEIDFNHDLIIPNVITPNEDGFNDSFEIKNIKLYPQNRLIIVNRYGKSILDKSGYKGGWDGDEAPAGIYYFTLIVPEKQREYKGWLQLIK